MSGQDHLRKMFPLRLAVSHRIQAVQSAEREGISLNPFVSIAIAEKVSRMRENAPAAISIHSKG
jgi:predicted HicB family RNase H-like nuclease